MNCCPRKNFTGIVFAVTLFTIFGRTTARAASCESLSALKLKDTTITLAQSVAAGELSLPGATGAQAAALKTLPAFCRVAAEVKPTADSSIKMEVWMPAGGWNGKYEGEGNGGFAGSITYPALVSAVRRGYATASTDTGHGGGTTDASWALGHQEKIVDFGYRGIHEMTVEAKAIIHAFYGEDPKKAYFASCSNGGRQALMEAQRYPEDYDGIIAGAPANFWTHLLVSGVWNLQAIQASAESFIPSAKIPALNAAVLAACDKKDGVTDSLLNDPRECKFDPTTMVCKEGDSNNCLTAPQAAALKKFYEGPKNSKGEQLFPGYVPGGEEGPGGWPLWITGQGPGTSLQSAFTTNFFKNMIFSDRTWDFKTFNFDSGVAAADKQAAVLNSTDPDMKAFKARGGKLLIYHGWSDAAIPAVNAINYYKSVASTMGAHDTAQFVRLYMVPGMQHCAGGPGPNSFGQLSANAPNDPQHNIYTALEQWVEKGNAPDKLIATKYVNDDPKQGVKMTRPLCPYPQEAQYKGTGDTNDQNSFVCAVKK
ncbi:MAG TPA: tannase/feruloyl esterase family alpha/beta hydrolase [Candidatus Angelobacter sp.]|nr:tannase/feruloyl esterase family alpha/beta hydrolase [Candidatus Angelobacter sp.]